MPFISFSTPGLPRDPLEFWSRLHRHPRHGFFLNFENTNPRKPVIFMSGAEPRRLLTPPPGKENEALSTIRRSFSSSTKEANIPRWVGLVSFEAGRSFDPGIGRLPSQPHPLKTPPLLFGNFGCVVKIDAAKKETTLYVDRGRQFCALKKNFERCFHTSRKEPVSQPRSVRKPPVPFKVPSKSHYVRMVREAQEAIARGDIYQTNLSLRFEKNFPGDPRNLYRLLWKGNPSPYSGLIKAGSTWVVSNSPELLLKVQGRSVATRPIAGTRSRGRTPREDRLRRGQLLLSPKERAEHIMLVDLERNDLGRVCRAGSVRVQERFTIERYSHVMHIVSHVRGELAKGKGAVEALSALFPGGTITGCPKIKAIEIIERLEQRARGFFYGSAGYFTGNGDAVFNILIRTALIRNQRLYIQVGAGIVADSRPDREYHEVLAKARALKKAVNESGRGFAERTL